jgi:hypothetical protein
MTRVQMIKIAIGLVVAAVPAVAIALQFGDTRNASDRSLESNGFYPLKPRSTLVGPGLIFPRPASAARSSSRRRRRHRSRRRFRRASTPTSISPTASSPRAPGSITASSSTRTASRLRPIAWRGGCRAPPRPLCRLRPARHHGLVKIGLVRIGLLKKQIAAA